MRISIVVVGKPGSLAPAIQEYERRATRYWRLETAVVPAARDANRRALLRREAAALRKGLRRGFSRVALTRQGDRCSSRELARWLEGLTVRAVPGVHFLVGGAFGLEPGLQEECCRRLSLSSLTLPRDLARLVLAEQLYRAGTILRNEPYHKGPR